MKTQLSRKCVRAVRAAAFVSTFALVLAACGGDDDDAAGTDPPVSDGAPEVSVSTASSAPSDEAESTDPPATAQAGSTPPSSANGPADVDPVRLGFIVPLSGNFVGIGADFVAALELFLEESGNTLGGRPVEVIQIDEGAGAAEALPGARQLILSDEVDVVTGMVSSGTAAAVWPEFEQAEIPLVASQGYPFSPPEAEASPFLWSPGSANIPFTSSMGEYMAQNVPEGESVYFLSADYVQGQAVTEATIAAFEAAGGDVAGVTYSPLGDTLDYQPYLSDVLNSGASAVFAFYSGADAVRFTQQFDTFGLHGDVTLYSTGSLIAGANLEEIGDAAVGVITNTHYAVELDNAENASFVAAYEAEAGRLPSNFAVQQYDNMIILDQAIAAIDGDLTPQAISEALAGVGELHTARGTWSIDPGSHLPLHSIYMFELKKTEDGEYVNELLEDYGVFHPVTGERVS